MSNAEETRCGDHLQRAYEVRRDGGTPEQLVEELGIDKEYAEWLMSADDRLYADWLARGGKRSFFS